MKRKHLTLVLFDLVALSFFGVNLKAIMGWVFALLLASNFPGVPTKTTMDSQDQRFLIQTKRNFAPLYIVRSQDQYSGYIVPEWQKGSLIGSHSDYSFAVPNGYDQMPVQTGVAFAQPGWFHVDRQGKTQMIETRAYNDMGTWESSWYEVLGPRDIHPLYFRGSLSPARWISLLIVACALAVCLHMVLSICLNAMWNEDEESDLRHQAVAKHELSKTANKRLQAMGSCFIMLFVLVVCGLLAAAFWQH